MNLTHLNANNNKVGDLASLRGLPLKRLYVIDSPVPDFAPLKGMALEELYM